MAGLPNLIKLSLDAAKKKKKKSNNYLDPEPTATQTITSPIETPKSVLIAQADIDKRTDLTPEQKKLEKGKYNIKRAKASSGKSLSIAREEEKAAQQQTANKAAQEFSQTPQLTEQDILAAVPQQENLERLQAGGAGVGAAVAGAGFGAKIGAGLGLLGGPAAPLTVPAGAALGAGVGFVGGAYTKISIDKRKDVRQALTVAKTSSVNFGQTIDALNAGTISKDVALERFREDRINLYAARANLKRETDTELNSFLSDGGDELTKTEDYVRDLEQIYTAEFILALTNPDPARIKYVQQNANVEE